MYMKRFSNRGFTLIEMLVVIAIIGIMMTIVFGSISNARIKSRDNKRISDLKEIKYALTQYYDYKNSFPATISSSADVQALSPFISQIPNDPSTNAPYDYANLNSGQNFCLGAVFENPANVSAVTDNAGCSTGASPVDTYTLKSSS